MPKIQTRGVGVKNIQKKNVHHLWINPNTDICIYCRQGLIRARLEGAKTATGDILLFLDSHCECGQDWLRPLLQRIKDEPKAFVVPIIDVIGKSKF